jgi:hypothetical protein
VISSNVCAVQHVINNIKMHTTHHGSHTPDISACTPLRAENDLWGPILSGLDVVGEMVSNPARIPQISNLYGNGLEADILRHLLGRAAGRFVKVNARNIACQDVAIKQVSQTAEAS